ncbi:hypothetical protein P3T27_002849 [Kitasatospora sp. MAA19]|uniref:hypothetical protein n=1 Tax=Kitasatospora sp. MAA19 TaxID=3035090 RepID=UPI0024731CDD|nr:hypothetical protein [Kitasatospora sp. MAA19]MDH6706126.1 hypothetical protein [Kitasatospora sp. MAA19]
MTATTDSAPPKAEPRRGSIPLTIALAIAAPLSIVGLTAAYGAYGWPAGLAVLVLATAVLSTGLGRLAGGTRGCLAALLVPIALLVAASATSNVRDDLVLSSGPTVTARVVGKERTAGTRDPSWDYSLASVDGSPVPGGRLNQRDQSLRVGDQVTVRFDPDGTARPKRPEQLDLGTDLFWAVAVLLAAALAVACLGLSSRPAGPLRDRLAARSRTGRERAGRLGAARTALAWSAVTAPWLLAYLLARQYVGSPLTTGLFALYVLAVTACSCWLVTDKNTVKPGVTVLATGSAWFVLTLFL